MPIVLSDSDKGLKALLARLKKSRKAITVGVHAGEGGEEYADGATVAQVATWNHFGTDRIPARPFLTNWFDANRAQIKDTLRKIGEKVFKGMDPQVAAEQAALWAEGGVKKALAAGTPPPNDPATIRQKGSSVPLIDSGQLRASIRGVVE